MLRKSPVRTPALIAANGRNALRSTGPRTVQGRARVSLNALKHGGRARHLRERGKSRQGGVVDLRVARIRGKVET